MREEIENVASWTLGLGDDEMAEMEKREPVDELTGTRTHTQKMTHLQTGADSSAQALIN